MSVNDRDRLWSAASAIIEGLGTRFGMFKNQALRIAWRNSYNCDDRGVIDGKGLTDEEISNVVAKINEIFKR